MIQVLAESVSSTPSQRLYADIISQRGGDDAVAGGPGSFADYLRKAGKSGATDAGRRARWAGERPGSKGFDKASGGHAETENRASPDRGSEAEVKNADVKNRGTESGLGGGGGNRPGGPKRRGRRARGRNTRSRRTRGLRRRNRRTNSRQGSRRGDTGGRRRKVRRSHGRGIRRGQKGGRTTAWPCIRCDFGRHPGQGW